MSRRWIKLEEIADLSGFAKPRPKRPRQRQAWRGWAVHCYIEACGIAPSNLVGQLGARAGLMKRHQCGVNAPARSSVMTG